MAVSPSLAAPYFDYRLPGGVRNITSSPNGQIIACGARSGEVAVFANQNLVSEFDVQPIRMKNKAEAELQMLCLGKSGDLTYCATSVDVLAINTNAADIAWEYQQRRQWGFLSSIPQGTYLTDDENIVITYSSGEMTMLDRKARVIETGYFNNAPKFLVSQPNIANVYGSDGNYIYSWDRQRLAGNVNQISKMRCYSLGLSGDGSTLVSRTDSRLVCIDTKTKEHKFEFEVPGGLPAIAVDEFGSEIAHLTEDRILLRSIDGTVNREIAFEDDFALSLMALKTGEGFLVGMRSGYVYYEPWS
ncbi:MAG: hypothetical protein KF824_02485 [Fimbriimonadaceae bacterium]|nr:MAG: hypothetical protein KF824_02485 [Fimbriimonadaceae bacterium]